MAKTSRIKQNLALQLTEGIRTFRDIHSHSLNELYQLVDTLTATEQRLSTTLGITVETLYTNSADWIGIALQQAGIWKENLDKLKDWYQWLQSYNKLNELGLGFIAEEYKEKNIPTDLLTSSFRKSFYQAVIHYIIAKEPTLELFNGKIFNDIITKYKQVSANFEDITKRNCSPDWLPTFRPSPTKPFKVQKSEYYKRIYAIMHAEYPSASYSIKYLSCCPVCVRVC